MSASLSSPGRDPGEGSLAKREPFPQLSRIQERSLIPTITCTVLPSFSPPLTYGPVKTFTSKKDVKLLLLICNNYNNPY